MRSRNIKPGFFKNEKLVELPVEARLLFIGLWCMADRKGRLEDRPIRIKMELYPQEQHDVSTMLEQLKTGGFIFRYEVNNNRYIQIINFEKHQHPHIHEQMSTIPAPCKHRANTMRARLVSDSLIPDSLILKTPAPDMSGAEVFDFELVWPNYPRKLGKHMARKHFQAQVKTAQDWVDINKAIQNFSAYHRKEGTAESYIPHGSTWFNERWKDWINYKGVEMPREKPAYVTPTAPDPPMTDEEQREGLALVSKLKEALKANGKTVDVGK